VPSQQPFSTLPSIIEYLPEVAVHFIVLTKTYLHGRNFTDGMIYVFVDSPVRTSMGLDEDHGTKKKGAHTVS
jgi:hypothetical protein